VGEFWQALEGKPKAALNYTVTVSVCCRAKTVMGNVSQEGLSAVWNSQMYQYFRRTVHTDSPPDDCRYCPVKTGLAKR
jgi:radical SAM protein with 4Fe4S-binding SPASM domain